MKGFSKKDRKLHLQNENKCVNLIFILGLLNLRGEVNVATFLGCWNRYRYWENVSRRY